MTSSYIPTEDDTFAALKKTSYRVVWEMCCVHINLDDVYERVHLIREAKRACGWTEKEFTREWDKNGSSWEKIIDDRG